MFWATMIASSSYIILKIVIWAAILNYHELLLLLFICIFIYKFVFDTI